MSKDESSLRGQKIADVFVKHQKELCAALRKQLYGCATPTIAILLGEDPGDVKRRYKMFQEGVEDQMKVEEKMHKEIWGDQ